MVALPPNFVTVNVNLPASGVSPQSFNTGLIIGESHVISSGTRVEAFSSVADMLTAGFTQFSPEVEAATLYFAAPSQPSQLLVGRKVSGETALTAIEACQAVNNSWYGVYDTTALDAEQAAVAAHIEAQSSPFNQYFLQSSTAGIIAATPGNIFDTLHTAKYKRTHGLYSTSPYAVASILGYAMGQTSNAANSAYTLKFKQLPGATPENLTTTQVNNVEGYDGNLYLNRTVNMYEQGINFSGDWFDEIIGLDMISNGIQVNVINLLYQSASVPQTEVGMGLVKNVVSQALAAAVTRGFLAPGQWNGPQILNLNPGDYLSAGYIVQSDPTSSQSQTDRSNRVAPNVYACVQLAGSLHSVAILVNVNR